MVTLLQGMFSIRYNTGMRFSRVQYGLLFSVIVLLVLVMSCTLVTAGVERGTLPALTFSMRLGPLRLITEVTDSAQCWRPTYGSAGPLCSTNSLLSPDRYYIGWLENRWQAPRRPAYQKLFVIRLPSV